MDQIDRDLAAAAQFQLNRERIKAGPFYTGSSRSKGSVTFEVERPSHDRLKRYVDRYLKSRKIGNTMRDFPFIPEFFPEELRTRALEVRTPNSMSNIQHPDDDSGEARTLEKVESAMLQVERKDEEDNEEEEDSGEEAIEDEFEEHDDDDYNAEKYFDDGDDDYGGDDDNEAAY